MRILHVLYDDVQNPWLGGGGAVRAREINRRLAPRHTITVLTGAFPGSRDETVDGVGYVRLGGGRGYVASRLSFTLALPRAVHRRPCDLLVNDFSLFSPCFASWYTRAPVVGVFHHILGRHSLRKYPAIGVLPYLAERWVYRRTRAVVTVSPSVTEEYRRRFPHEATIECIPNGVDTRLFATAPGDPQYCLFLGRVDVYMKGLDVLLEAWRRLPAGAPPLKIVGRGQARDVATVRRLIQEKGLAERVRIQGPLTETQKPALFRNALLLCLASRFEGWGIVAVEAAAAGIPVVGTDIPGLRDAIQDGRTGRLVPPENAEALAAAIRWFLDHPENRREYGERGRTWARQFQWDLIAQRQEAFYETVVAAARRTAQH